MKRAMKKMLKGKGISSVSSDKMRQVLRGVQMVKDKVRALVGMVGDAMDKVKGFVIPLLDKGKSMLLDALSDGKAKFNQVSSMVLGKLKGAWKMAREMTGNYFTLFAEKKKSVYDLVDKYLSPVQKAIAGVKGFLAKLKASGSIGDFIMGIVQNEVYVSGERDEYYLYVRVFGQSYDRIHFRLMRIM